MDILSSSNTKMEEKQQQHGDCAKYIERLIIQAFFVHQLNNKNVLLVALDFLGTKDLQRAQIGLEINLGLR